jgi:signal transduction histidine kinase
MNSIRIKIIIFAGAILLTVVFFQLFFSLFLSKNFYTYLKKSQVEKVFNNLKNNYSDDTNEIHGIVQYAENAHNIDVMVFCDEEVIYWNRGPGILPPEIDMLQYVDEPKVEVHTLPQRPPFQSSQMPPPAMHSPERPPLDMQAPSIPPSFMEPLQRPPRLPYMGEGHITLSGKFDYLGQTRYVRIRTFVESIDASVNSLALVNSLIAGFMLVAGVIGSLVFSKIFSKPILSITEVARNVALLNFETRADENVSTAELRVLSNSINTMSDKLKKLISDLQASNEKLQADVDHQMRLDKMRREFIANVSHELKSPLHLLLMYTENLKNNIENIDKNYYCDTIIEETNRLNDMVKSLLDLSAIENGLAKMSKEIFNISDFSENLISKMSPLFQNLPVAISVDKEIYVEGDSRYIEQVVKNYVANAVSHTPENGRISVTLIRLEDDALFTVFNEGSSIADEDIPHIWESFYKADKSRTRAEESHVGLGLYIVKTIMQAHDGRFGVRNTENGVEFWFSLPEKKKI